MTPQDTVNKLREEIELLTDEGILMLKIQPEKEREWFRDTLFQVAALTARTMISKPIPDEAERKGWSNDYVVGYACRVGQEQVLADLIEKL
jgi:hypothetical protein